MAEQRPLSAVAGFCDQQRLIDDCAAELLSATTPSGVDAVHRKYDKYVASVASQIGEDTHAALDELFAAARTRVAS